MATQPTKLQSGVLATVNRNLVPYQLLASYHPEISGMALVAQNTALTSWQQSVVANSELLPQLLMTLPLEGYPLQFVLYCNTLSLCDIHLIVLSGILLSLLVAASFTLSTSR